RAPAVAAIAPVSSGEPSSTTRISSQGAAAARSRTTGAIEATSLKAGITIDVCAARTASVIRSALGHEAIDDTIPADRACALVAGIAERLRASRIGGQMCNRRAERLGCRFAHQPGDSVVD